jgi:hypothetical protein
MAPGVGGTKAALRALLGSLWLCGCTGDAHHDTGGPAATAGTTANQTCGSQCKQCAFSSDCDQGRSRGGYACIFPEMMNARQDVQSSTRSDGESRVGALPRSSLSAEDAGADLDGGPVVDPEHRSSPIHPSTGVCSTMCDSTLCTDPGMVCSSPTGFCREGCDRARPNCQSGQACDFSPKKKHCFDLKGECQSAGDCPVFDARLVDALPVVRGVVTCEEQRCRYTPNSPDLTVPVQTSLALDALPELRVDSPQPGDRITPSELPSYKFQFLAPAQAIVASILIREPRSLEDGASAALWTAYLDGKQALDGVTLAQGGTMVNGEWRSYLGAALTVPHEVQLYFLVIGYARGERVAQSKLVPFTVGGRRPRPGDVCLAKDGEFCAKDSALLCMENVCRTPCLSDADCAPEGQWCYEPNWLSIPARVCRE